MPAAQTASHYATPLPPGKGPSPGTLYLVATPIGNLADITLRALEVLRRVSLIAAEDTRVTRRLLSHHGISARLLSCRAQNEREASRRILEALAGGKDVALVSDAGTPGISDPGQRVVSDAIARGLPVVPVPGPSAILSALIVSGLPTGRFLFLGFLPVRPGPRRRAIEAVRGAAATLLLFESPRRLRLTLAALAAVLGDRPAAVARELTKVHEEVRRGRLLELAAEPWRGGEAPVRGEAVLVVAGAEEQREPEIAPEEAEKELAEICGRPDRSPRAAARLVAERLGVSRNRAYAMVLAYRAKRQGGTGPARSG